jgi:hypothetical protein
MLAAIVTLIPSIIALLGALLLFARWVGKVDQNTRATEKLTEAFDAFSGKIGDKVDDHEVRIRVLESKVSP